VRLVIAEDEAVIARRLERMVRERVPGAEIELAASLDAALALVRHRRFDVLLLDLNLGGRDGFRVLEEAAAGPFQTIVVSAHHDQALRAFEYGVLDFVAKPWTAERLERALARVAAHGATAGGGARRLAVRCGRELRTVGVESVLLVRGADDYSELHLTDGSVHLHEKSLAALAAILPPVFARVHRSYIVNLERVRAVRTAPGGRRAVVLADGREVPVGRVYREAVLGRLAV
jgi:DNA-binding LytR/AlgR family response regulator